MNNFRKCCLLLPFFVVGCAFNTRMVALTDHDESVARDLFRDTLAQQKKCSPWADAEMNVSLHSAYSSGTFAGYLQVMTPAYIKFVATNPFGQPLLAFTSDGKDFQYLSFTAKNYYEGAVTAQAFSRYTPSGFDPADGFYWLIGRIGPGEFNIQEAGGDVMNRGYWVKLVNRENDIPSLILFDPDRKTILDHTLLDDTGGVAMRAEYSSHASGDCGLPATITISGDEYPGQVTLRLSDWQGGMPFTSDDFHLEIPEGFKRVTVK